MAEIGRKGGQASAKARGEANAQPSAKPYAQAQGQASAKADAQQNKEKKIKEKKENKINAPDGVSALSGDGSEIFIHENSGIQFVVKNGKQFDLSGKPLNDAGYPIIDFKLSKHNN